MNKQESILLEAYFYNKIKKQLKENFFFEDDNTEKDSEQKMPKHSESDDSKKDNSDDNRKRTDVMGWLKKKSQGKNSYVVNHADIMRKLWHPKDQGEDDELRSLFTRKMNEEPNDEGSYYRFSDEEINSLYKIMNGIL